MRPNYEEIVRGVQAALLAQVLPEVQTEYARTQVTLMYVLLGIVANGADTSYERLLTDHAALAELAMRVAASEGAPDELADELRSRASATASTRLTQLASENVGLQIALARAAMAAGPEAALRGEIVELLRRDAEARSLSLMGPRADG